MNAFVGKATERVDIGSKVVRGCRLYEDQLASLVQTGEGLFRRQLVRKDLKPLPAVFDFALTRSPASAQRWQPGQ